MIRWAILEHNGYRFEYHSEIEAQTVNDARRIAALTLGGDRMTSVPGQPKRRFRVTNVSRKR